MSKLYTNDDFDEMYDKMEDMAKYVEDNPFFPDGDQLDRMAEDPKKYYKFMVYLLAANPTPKNADEAECMKIINDIVKENTEFQFNS